MTSKYSLHVGRFLLVAAVVFSCSGLLTPHTSHADDSLVTRVVVRDQNIPVPQAGVDYGTLNGNVYSSQVGTDGTTYVGGSFAAVSGKVRNNAAAFSSTGQLQPWNPNADDSVSFVALDNTTVYMAGNFTKIGTTARNHAAAVNTTTGDALPWNPQLPSDFYVTDILVGPLGVYVLGSKESDYGGEGDQTSATNPSYEQIYAFDKTSGNKLWSATTDSDVQHAALKDNTLYITGGFTKVNGTDRLELAALNISNGQLTSLNPNPSKADGSSSIDNAITALTISGNNLYVAGFFTEIAGQSRSFVASFDTTSGALTSWQPKFAPTITGEDFYIMTIAVYNGNVYLGGSFGDGTHYSIYNMVLVDKDGNVLYWPIDMGQNVNFAYDVPNIYDLYVNDHYLYVGAYQDYARYDLNSLVQPTSALPTYLGPPVPAIILPESVHSGELLKFQDNPTVYLVESQGLYPFASFYSLQLYLGSSKEQITHLYTPVTDYTMASDYSTAGDYIGQYLPSNQPYVPGTLINSKGTVFLITAGEQIPFQNKQAFLGLGYSFKDVINMDLTGSGLTQTQGIYTDKVPHTWGTWLNYNGTVYYSDETGMIPVPDWDTFLANDGLPQMIKDMNQYDLDVYFQNPNLPILSYQDPRVSLSPNDPPYDPVQYRDQTRVNDVNSIEEAAFSYFADHNSQYPASLGDLVPTYLDSIPVAPTPPDGTCTTAQNTYTYSGTGDHAQISFCLGEANGDFKAGVNVDKAASAADFRDLNRLINASIIASDLNSYKDDNGKYPNALSDLVPKYMDSMPVAPTPPDGSCSATQNAYGYQKLSDTTFKVTFCMGGTSDSLSQYAGPHYIDQDGNLDGKTDDYSGSLEGMASDIKLDQFLH